VCGGGARHNACGRRHLPAFDRRSTPVFIRSVNFDPKGAEHWLCRDVTGDVTAAAAGDDDINRFTLRGSFYHAYVRLAACPPPTGR